MSDEENQEINPLRIYKDTLSRSYTCYLTSEIAHEEDKYYELFRLLDGEANSNDIINIKIRSNGGSMDTGTMLAHSISTSEAKVVMHCVGNNYSMAAFLCLCGDALIIYPGTFLMFHNYSGGNVGKGGEIVTGVKADRKNFKDFMDYFCSPFLTDKEIQTILGDQDIYIHWDDRNLSKRLDRHFNKDEEGD